MTTSCFDKPLEAGAETNQAIDGDANQEIDQDAQIHLKTLVLQRWGQVVEEGEVVDGVAQDYGGQVLQPSPRGGAEDFLLLLQGPFLPGGGDHPEVNRTRGESKTHLKPAMRGKRNYFGRG